MGLLHHIHYVFKKHALAKLAHLLAVAGFLQRRRQILHVPQFLDADGQCGHVGGGEGSLHALDDGVDGSVTNRLCFTRDGPRVVLLGTRE